MMPDTETDSHAPRGWVKPYTGNAKCALVYTPAHPNGGTGRAIRQRNGMLSLNVKGRPQR